MSPTRLAIWKHSEATAAGCSHSSVLAISSSCLDDAINRQGLIGTAGKTIIVTLTGEFWRHSKGNPDFLLIIDKAEDLDAKLKEKPK